MNASKRSHVITSRSRSAAGVMALAAVVAVTVAVLLGAATRVRAADSLATGSATFGAAQGISRLNPAAIAVVSTLWERQAQTLVYSALTHYTETGGTSLQPDLARSWKTSKNGLTYTFLLRPGLKFSNGNPLTAATIAATYAQRLKPATGSAPAELNSVDYVAAPNATTVRFFLKWTDPFLLYAVSTIYIPDPATLTALPAPAGSGPYMIKEFVADDHLTLAPNPNYYGEKARLATLNIVNLHDNTAAVTALRGGTVDGVWQLPFLDVATLAKQTGYTVLRPEHETLALTFDVDTSSPPFNDVRARQALSYAIDRNTIRNAVYRGVGTVTPTSQPVPPTNLYFGKGLPTYPYDLQKAKQLFAQAGITSGATITYWTHNATVEARLQGEVLQSSLSQIGIKLHIQVNDVPTWIGKFSPPPKKWPNAIVPRAFLGLLPNSLYYRLIGREGKQNPNNVPNFYNSQFERAVTAAMRETNEATRKELWRKVEHIYSKRQPAPIIMIYAIPTVLRSGVKGVFSDPAGNTHFEHAYRG